MDTKSFQLVEKIYYRILDENPKDIQQFISNLAIKDDAIIDKVMSLLHIEDSKALSKTNNQVLASFTKSIDDQLINFNSDKYQLLEKIGEGGMGSVYLASRKDEEVELKVAIKLINAIFTTNINIERFKKERQILASLDHQNIARFIDAGTTSSGILFVVMEYVQGKSLRKYCLDGNFTVKEKLALILQLCDAIEYAHKNFIIHRDIKPANILVTQEGKLKLLDFGIAKLVNEDSVQTTATITKIMTPAYASPEQLLGKNITIQSDIYALGVVLFEILLGFRPYQNFEKDPISFQVKVVNGLSTTPSQLYQSQINNNTIKEKKKISTDVDALLTKAINPDIKKRYQTVVEFKSDINYYLQGFPVKARKANKLYFISLLIKRNKLTTTLSTLSLIVIIVFSGFSYLQNIKLEKRGRELQLQSKELSVQRDEAILQAKKAKLASNFLLDSFQTADPTRTFGENLTIKQVIENSYEKLNKDSLEDKELSAELYHTISNAFYGMDKMQLASESAIHGLNNLKEVNKPIPLLQVKLNLAYGKSLYALRKLNLSLSILESTLLLCQEKLQIADCLNDEIYLYMAKIYFNKGNLTKTKKYITNGLSWSKKNGINDLRFIKLLLLKANVENDEENPKDSIKTITRIKSMLSLDNKIENYYYIEAEIQYILALSLLHKDDEAMHLSENILKLVKNRYGTNNYLYIKAANINAHILKQTKHFKQCAKRYDEIIKISKELHSPYYNELNKLGLLYYHRLYDYNKAIKYFKSAILQFKQSVKIENKYLGFMYRNLAMAYFKNKDNKNSLIHYIKSKEVLEQVATDQTKLLKAINEWIVYLKSQIS